MRRLAFQVLFCSAALLLPTATPARAQGAPGLNVYPSFHVKFMHAGKTYLLASTVIVNVSESTMRDLTLVQQYPDEVAPEQAGAGIHEYFTRPEGSSDSVEGRTYTMKTPLLRRGEITSAVVTLRFKGRPSSATIPPAHITFAAAGKMLEESGPPLTLDLTKYTKYSGKLMDFIKRYAGIIISIPRDDGPDWGFSSFASRVRGKTPLGMVEIEGDAEEGRFSLVRGAPGETRVMLVSWKPESTARPAESKSEALEVVRRQIMPSADFNMDDQGTVEILKGKLGRNQAWVVSGRWKDKVVDRLGEGPVRWYVYNDSSRARQYVVMIAAQGRGAGPEKSSTPAGEQEAALMKELESILESFRPL